MEKNSHLKRLQDLGPLEVLRADLEEEKAVAGCHYAFLIAASVNLASKNPEVHSIPLFEKINKKESDG
jgi:anthocyanidin reductase